MNFCLGRRYSRESSRLHTPFAGAGGKLRTRGRSANNLLYVHLLLAISIETFPNFSQLVNASVLVAMQNLDAF